MVSSMEAMPWFPYACLTQSLGFLLQLRITDNSYLGAGNQTSYTVQVDRVPGF
jgi:hypothetical protein